MESSARLQSILNIIQIPLYRGILKVKKLYRYKSATHSKYPAPQSQVEITQQRRPLPHPSSLPSPTAQSPFLKLPHTPPPNMATTQTVILAERPKGDVQPGKTFKMHPQKKLHKDDLKPGQALVQTIYLSLDPAMRVWLNEARSYVPPIPIGGVMGGAVIARVVASKSDRFEVGGHVYAGCGWREEAVVEEKDEDVLVLDVPRGGRLTDAMGVLGMFVVVLLCGHRSKWYEVDWRMEAYAFGKSQESRVW